MSVYIYYHFIIYTHYYLNIYCPLMSMRLPTRRNSENETRGLGQTSQNPNNFGPETTSIPREGITKLHITVLTQ